MSQLTTTDVAVIGVGYCATALVADLVDRLPPSTRITLVGPRRDLGRGVAYGTDDRGHLLNVPAGRMSFTAADPDHFVRWLADRGTGYGPADFVPRTLYGHYLRDSLAAALRRTGNRCEVRHVDATADGYAVTDEGGLPFRLSTGDVLLADQAVLCVGAASAGLPLPADAIDPSARARVVETPWRAGWSADLDPEAAVVLVGTGLTMVDQVLALVDGGHRGPIHALSRHGLVPQAHRIPRAGPIELDLAPRETGLARALNEFRQATRHLDDWRAVMDGLRPVTQSLWAGLSEAEKARFLRHLLPYWAVHRHRMAPEVAARIADLRADGRLVIHAARLERIDASTRGGALVRLRPRGSRSLLSLEAEVVVNCCGAERCPSLSGSRLLSDLAARGLVVADPLGLGIQVDEDSGVIGADGGRTRGLHALGPLTAGRFWEITAVPDIRTQVARVGETLARRRLN